MGAFSQWKSSSRRCGGSHRESATHLHDAPHCGAQAHLRFEEESPHKAILAERIGHVKLTIHPSRHRPLQAEPAHVVRIESARHTDVSVATLPMAVDIATLR